VSIAYARHGSGVPLVLTANIWSHLTTGWMGELRDATRALTERGFEVIRYDIRGSGLSQREVSDFSLSAQLADLEALVEHLGIKRFALCGLAFSTLVAIAYAARHADRVSHLVLTTPIASGDEMYRAMPSLQGLESLRAMGDEQWELYTATHAAAIVEMTYRGEERSGTQAHDVARFMREAMTPNVLRNFLLATRQNDVSGELGNVKCPTLVVERVTVPAMRGLGRQVAAAIPGARLVSAPGGWWYPALAEVPLISEFVLGERGKARKLPSKLVVPATMAVIFFADIVDSTVLTERLGDAAFREKARGLDEALRAAIREHSGTAIEGKLLGDGVLATFASAREAISCALACGTAGDNAGLRLHLGLHAGDVLHEEGNVFGGAVNIAARIADASAPGEVLVSDIVRGLARTSAGVVFEDRGERALKGIEEPQRLWAVREEA
jgi:class 3 adenylate cyclase/pimeloyl-ACP methyl ester carboxylesterase